MGIRKLLEDYKNGNISIEDAEKYIESRSFKELSHAKIDFDREERTGFPETIYCQGKTAEQIIEIFNSFIERGENVLGTRASKEQYNIIKKEIPQVEFDDMSGVLKHILKRRNEKIGNIVICSAGTSDMRVSEEAAQVAEYFGANVTRIYDIGVAGIHRLFSKLDKIRRANVIIAVAGMEGALPGVLAGLVEVPVIAVPTSVGYGANFEGLSALLTMLNACAEGIAVVNIDNGFGAAYIASQINKGVYKNER